MSVKPWTEAAATAAPHIPRNRETDVWVPTFQAGILALGVGALLSVVLAGFLAVGSMWDKVGAWSVAVGALGGLVVFVWQVWAGFDLRRALWLAEAGLHVDLDGDGKKGKPERAIILNVGGQTGGAALADGGDHQPQRADVTSPRDDLYAFLVRCYTAGPGRSAWLRPGQNRLTLPSGVGVTRGVYDGYMADLAAAGIVVKNGNGWETVVPVETAMAACGLVGRWSADGRPAQTRQIEPGG